MKVGNRFLMASLVVQGVPMELNLDSQLMDKQLLRRKKFATHLDEAVHSAFAGSEASGLPQTVWCGPGTEGWAHTNTFSAAQAPAPKAMVVTILPAGYFR